jgi:hypothetical protein
VRHAAGPYSSEACCLGLYLAIHWMPVITQLWMNLLSQYLVPYLNISKTYVKLLMNCYLGMQMLSCSRYTWSSSDACERNP